METDAHSDREGSSAQKQLERSRRDLEDFFENGAVGLHWVASDGSILRVNQAELDLLGMFFLGLLFQRLLVRIDALLFRLL
jgi:hypothetical protein